MPYQCGYEFVEEIIKKAEEEEIYNRAWEMWLIKQIDPFVKPKERPKWKEFVDKIKKKDIKLNKNKSTNEIIKKAEAIKKMDLEM